MYSVQGYPAYAEWVSPFGNLRIKVCLSTPRSLSQITRPSSPLTAKASTVYACSLNHITPNRKSYFVKQSVSSKGPKLNIVSYLNVKITLSQIHSPTTFYLMLCQSKLECSSRIFDSRSFSLVVLKSISLNLDFQLLKNIFLERKIKQIRLIESIQTLC